MLVDTSVWSLALRRRAVDLSAEERAIRDELAALVADDRVLLVGPVRQEILSGIRERVAFERLRECLRPFDDVVLETADFEAAAESHNACRAAGVASSAVDVLLCAVAMRRDVPIFTTDKDFQRYAGVLPIRLHGATPAEH